MARKSQVKDIAARAKTDTPNDAKPVDGKASPTPTASSPSRSKKAAVQRPKPLKFTEPSPIAIRMEQDLQLAGVSQRTARSYVRVARKPAADTKKSPDVIDEGDSRANFYYIRNDQLWEPSTIRVTYSGIELFYKHICPRDWRIQGAP